MKKFSIIIPCFNNIAFTEDCLNSIFRNTKDFELVLINNGSSDSTKSYFEQILIKHLDTKIITFEKNMGFARAVNEGITAATGEYLIVLNNDTLVGPNWALRLMNTLLMIRKLKKDSSFCFIGPVSNNASGIQSADVDVKTITDMDKFCNDFAKEKAGPPNFTHFLSGFCFMFPKSIIPNIVLFDVNYKIGGFEDNDFFLNATLKGYKCIVDNATFVFHHGQQTLAHIPDYSNKIFFENNLFHVQKHSLPEVLKLCVTLRVKNGADQLPYYIENVKKFCDSIIALDNGSTDDTYKILSNFPGIFKHLTVFDDFNEARDRQYLLSKAFELGYDWALSLDLDERIPDSFDQHFFQKLMHPANPDILAYSMNVFTFFEGTDYIRQDYPWSNLQGIRLYRLFPNQNIDIFGKKGLHCSHSPSFSPYNTRHISMPILLYGYINEVIRSDKSNFYSKMDNDPFQPEVGPFGYKHLTTSEVLLTKYSPNNNIALCILCNADVPALFNCLYQHYSFFNEINILHTGKNNLIKSVCASFNANYYHKPFKGDFSDLRNYLMAQSNSRWVFFLDTDEIIEYKDFTYFTQMILRDVDGYLFIVWNYQPDGSILFSDNVRLIKKSDKVYFTHPIHESISDSVKENHLDIIPAPVPIRHSGFLKSKDSKKVKSNLYLDILKKELKHNPKDPSVYFHLSFHYFENGNNQMGLDYLKHVIKLDPEFFLAHRELGLRYLDICIGYLQQCMEVLPREHYYHNFISRLTEYVSQAKSINFNG